MERSMLKVEMERPWIKNNFLLSGGLQPIFALAQCVCDTPATFCDPYGIGFRTPNRNRCQAAKANRIEKPYEKLLVALLRSVFAGADVKGKEL